MKKNILLTAVALALSLSWVGCNKSGKLNKTSEHKVPSGPVELKLKWPVGERIVQDMDMKMNMEFSIPGRPAPMETGHEHGARIRAYGVEGNPRRRT